MCGPSLYAPQLQPPPLNRELHERHHHSVCVFHSGSYRYTSRHVEYRASAAKAEDFVVLRSAWLPLIADHEKGGVENF